jgi:pyruvate formate lyase activating enzyme
MSASTSLRRVDLLPFHRIAAGKYRRLQRTNPFSEIEPPDLEAIDKVRKRFENHGLDVHIGG